MLNGYELNHSSSTLVHQVTSGATQLEPRVRISSYHIQMSIGHNLVNYGGVEMTLNYFGVSILHILNGGRTLLLQKKWRAARAVQPFFTEYLFYLVVHHLFHYFKVLKKVYIIDFK